MPLQFPDFRLQTLDLRLFRVPRNTRNAVSHATHCVAKGELLTTPAAPVPISGLTRFRF